MDFFMNDKKLKGVYLHGYQGYVTDEKKDFLNQFGDVYAPNIDYDQNPMILFDLYEKYKNEEIDFVAGTSLGGILIFHLAMILNKPCLLLNPAVTAMDQIKSFIPENAYNLIPNKKVNVVIGMKDTIVDPTKQLLFFNNYTDDLNLIDIKIKEDLDHFIPYDLFVELFQDFKNELIK